MVDLAVVLAYCFLLDKYLNYLEKLWYFLKKMLDLCLNMTYDEHH